MRKISEAIVVDADGEIIEYIDGEILSDNPETLEYLGRRLFFFPVRFVMPFGTEVRPSLNPQNIVGIAAALMSVKPGRSRVLEAPPEFWEWFDAEYATYGGGCIPTRSSGKDISLNSKADISLDSKPYEYPQIDQPAALGGHKVDELLEELLDDGDTPATRKD